ncbi:37S ribosomal protein S10, mitochondrial [Aspergillus falconensis]
MSLFSPYRVIFKTSSLLQLAAASRAFFSTSSQLGNAKDAQSTLAEQACTEEPVLSSKSQSTIPNQGGLEEKTSQQAQTHTDSTVKEWGGRLTDLNTSARLPRSVQALYLRPLRRKAEYGLPVCDLQLRSYSVRNLEFFADFAIRAAYYLNLPASGPVPLPKIVERWTFPRSSFVHKKSQENFERITVRRLIQIKDGESQAVQAWLAFLRRHAFYGVGMKANIWEHEDIEITKHMDQAVPEIEKNLEPHLSQFGRREDAEPAQDLISNFLGSERLSLNKGPLANVRS